MEGEGGYVACRCSHCTAEAVATCHPLMFAAFIAPNPSTAFTAAFTTFTTLTPYRL